MALKPFSPKIKVKIKPSRNCVIESDKMLTESFIASTSNLENLSNTSISKDIGVYHYELQPLPGLKSTWKKSSTKQNCLAVTSSHIFAAQEEKSVVHVYEREKGAQEAIVPFPERIRSIALAGDVNGASTLVLGMEGGRLILWEVLLSLPRFKVHSVDVEK